MTRDELKESIAFLTDDNPDLHSIVYTVDVADSVRYLDIADALRPEIQEMFRRKVVDTFNNDNYELMNYSTADRRDGCFYLYDLDEKPAKMELTQSVIGDDTIPQFDFAEDSIGLINALVIVLSSANGDFVSLFKPLSDVEKYLSRRDFIICESNHRFVKSEKDMIRLSPGFQIAFINGEYVMLQPKKMAKLIGLDKVLINTSHNEATRFQRKNIIEDISQLTQYCNNDLKFCKELIAAVKGSPLFDQNNPKTAHDAIEYAKRVNKKFRGTGRFHFNARGDRFVIQNKLQAERFLRLINNDYLNSDFTGGLFESLAKNKI